ncbi:MAG: type II toxin-antitoxin system YafQ family toxin [Bacteroidales bacterium]
MLEVRYATRFKKDFKFCIKRNYDMSLLQQAIETLMLPAPLPAKNKDHNLTGNYSGYRECHIQPDWLLVYQQTDTELLLYRTGSHADLFSM